MDRNSGSNYQKNEYIKKCKHIIPRIGFGIMLLLFCLFLGMPIGNSNTVQATNITIVPNEKLVIGIPDNRCPIFYRDQKTGKSIGIGTDLIRKAAVNAGYNPEFVFIKEKKQTKRR